MDEGNFNIENIIFDIVFHIIDVVTFNLTLNVLTGKIFRKRGLNSKSFR